uniref:C-CAP/cofactor C-like domain-containing protein n=1 Tax=Odontella aurita TaxID=265563 RepID=A0A6U6IXW2_9STRA|mmetsp:Transcript_53931/g.161402  ORF Transcript_53931/g.161402 Transcript_53931/m.161402 type:complete len:1020 (+) Transcript_53931:197-3256(+)
MATTSARSSGPPLPLPDGGDSSDRDSVKLTAKPHAFGGSVLTPKHARELTPSLVLAATAALSEQANAPQPPPPPRRGRTVSGDSARSGSSPSNSAAFRHIHSVGSTDTAGSGHTFGSIPSADPSSVGASASRGGGGVEGKVQYTVWITEAWRVLGWAEPSAALFWEMATMYHTLHVAARSVEASAYAERQSQSQSGGQSGVQGRRGSDRDGGEKKEADGGGGEDMVIPPILSCGSTSSMGSDKQKGVVRPPSPTHGHGGGPSTPTASGSSSAAAAGAGGSMSKALSKSGGKGQSASAKELPVWLVGTYLLLHCEESAYLRNISGEDERRFAGSEAGDGIGSGGGAADVLHGVGIGSGVGKGGRVDFSTLLQHSSLSPRTRIHAGLHADNSHCTAYLLRHLRKFLLLCAVPHNPEAVWAITAIADSKPHDDEYAARSAQDALSSTASSGPDGEGDSPGGKTTALGPLLSQPTPRPDVEELRIRHDEDHGAAGLEVRLTAAELERLNLVLQAPSGGLIEDLPMRVGDYLVSMLGGGASATSSGGQMPASVTVADAEREIRKHLEKDVDEGDDASASEDEAAATKAMAGLSLEDSKGGEGGVKGSSHREIMRRRQSEIQEQGYHKELSYTNLRGTTILIKPNSHPDNQKSSSSSSPFSGALPGRLHDLHVSECSDAHMYLLQPFEHATIAACTDCTIVVGAVAGLLHVVDCERVTITSAARRVLVSNCADVLHCVFTPSPPLLVGDNRACQFAPYNTYYDGLKEDLLSTGLAAAIVSSPPPSSSSSDVGVSTPDAVAHHPPSLQCASNKWKVPVELAKLEIPQVHMGTGGGGGTTPGSPASGEKGGGASSPGADEKAVLSGKPGEDTLQTPVLLPSSEFHILFVPIESEAARTRRRAEEAAGDRDESQSQFSEAGDDGSAAGGGSVGGSQGSKGRLDSQYCRILADVLQLSPFRLPTEYERRALVKADRMRSLQVAMEKDLTAEQQLRLEEELNCGFRDWLVTSGNLRQVLDLVHMERKGGV